MKFDLKLPWWHRLLRPIFELRAMYRDWKQAREWRTAGYMIFGATDRQLALTLAFQRNGVGKRRVIFYSGFRIDLLGHSPLDSYVFHRASYGGRTLESDWVARLRADPHIRAWVDGDEGALGRRLWHDLPPPEWSGWRAPRSTKRKSKTSQRTKPDA
jgi:hypothetical protein